MDKWIVYGDGSCLGNPGPGGWAALIEGHRGHSGEVFANIELTGGASDTTNNRMELEAALAALNWLKSHVGNGDAVELRLDSKYVLDGMFKWCRGWEARGWRKSGGDKIKNDDLWIAIAEKMAEIRARNVMLIDAWVRGHNGEQGNERVDDLARAVAKKYQSQLTAG